MAITWSQLRERINQISGIKLSEDGVEISWEPRELDLTRARKLIVFLEDKRALYYDLDLELIPYVTQSVEDMRDYIVQHVLRETDKNTTLYRAAKELRDACVAFLDLKQQLEWQANGVVAWTASNNRLTGIALRLIRRRFGKPLEAISVTYRVDVDEDLATIIPSSPNYNENLVKEA